MNGLREWGLHTTGQLDSDMEAHGLSRECWRGSGKHFITLPAGKGLRECKLEIFNQCFL